MIGIRNNVVKSLKSLSSLKKTGGLAACTAHSNAQSNASKDAPSTGFHFGNSNLL